VSRLEWTCLRWRSREQRFSATEHAELTVRWGSFHAKKFGTKTYAGANKKVALKVQTSGATKKQKKNSESYSKRCN
jgi:hypothetical protein